jgi:hypothetical protein
LGLSASYALKIAEYLMVLRNGFKSMCPVDARAIWTSNTPRQAAGPLGTAFSSAGKQTTPIVFSFEVLAIGGAERKP